MTARLPLICAIATLAFPEPVAAQRQRPGGESIDVTAQLAQRIVTDARWPGQAAVRRDGRGSFALIVTRRESAPAVQCPKAVDRIDLSPALANGFAVEWVTLRGLPPDRGYNTLESAKWRLEAPQRLSTNGARPPVSLLVIEPPVDRYARRSGYRPPREAPCRSAYSLRVTLRGPTGVDPFGDPRAPGGNRLHPDGAD